MPNAFGGPNTIFGVHWVVIPAVLLVLLVVVVAMAFSGGLVGGGDVNTTPAGGAATSGANGTVQQVLNQSRNVSLQNTTEVVGARNNTSTRNTTATLNATPTRTVDPNSTPWNAAIGAGIYHTEGGTHYVGPSNEIALKQREAKMTPTPASLTGWGEGSGHATGPLSWVGTGNWSPGFIDLPAGDAQVVLLSQGTSAFILADESDARAGFGVFLPPGGTYTVPVPQAGRYVIAFGTANKTDTWSATVLLPSGGQAAAPPVPTPNAQIFTYAGNGGGSPGSFNLTPGTVHVALTADQMTMAYIKDPWGVTLSTAVAGPYAGGSTAVISKTGTYRLDVYGTGAWTAVVTWTGTPASGAPTVPTVRPVTTLTPWIATATPTTNATAPAAP